MAPPNKLPTRKLGKNGPEIVALGLGLMGLSIGYGSISADEERLAFLDRAWELGCTTWDTADSYGDSEDLVGKWLKLHPERRQDIFLATKFAIKAAMNPDGSYAVEVDSTPEHARAACGQSLRRLGVDSVDLLYIHRLDEKTPIEKTVAAMAELVKEGKVKHIGISECSSRSLRRAHAVHPIAAVQVEYNPWTLDIENDEGTRLLATCRELGVAVFAYAPLGRGMMTGRFTSPDDFEPDDWRRTAPRFSKENFPKNIALVGMFRQVADRKGCTSGQLALAWLMAQGDDIFPIPGTRRIKYLEENIGAAAVQLTPEEVREIRNAVDEAGVYGGRNPEGFLNQFADTPEM